MHTFLNDLFQYDTSIDDIHLNVILKIFQDIPWSS